MHCFTYIRSWNFIRVRMNATNYLTQYYTIGKYIDLDNVKTVRLLHRNRRATDSIPGRGLIVPFITTAPGKV